LKNIDTIIFGATALAYPIAAKLGSNCLVIERGISAGAEFSDAMNASPVDISKNPTELTQKFRDELQLRNILSEDGRLHILAVGGVLAGLYLETGCKLLLNTAVISVEQMPDGKLVTIFSPEEGFSQYYARQVIDTRVADFMECRKTFGVLLALEKNIEIFDDGDVYLQKGYFADEFILRFRIDRDTSLPDVQRRSDEWLSKNLTRLGSAKVAGIALEFGWEFKKPIELVREGVRYIPSASYPDVVSAVEGGEAVCL
jgi:hypothetical protein